MSNLEPLQRAQLAIKDARFADALDALVEAWDGCAHREVAQLVAALAVEARPEPPPPLRGKTAAVKAEWNRRAGAPRGADVSHLLESLVDVSSNDATARLALVATWMPDPRVDAAFTEILKTVPYRATSTQKFWRALFPLMQDIRDPSQLARLEAITFEGVAVTMGGWLRTQRDKLVVKLRPRLTAAPPPLPPIVRELAAALASGRAANVAERAGIDELLHAVYANPDDDAARMVYADALMDRGDPRGELITVQTRLVEHPDDRALRAREKELLETHGKTWLGDLARIVIGGGRFERGFLAECRLDSAKLDHVKQLVGHPAWSTVHTLTGSALIAFHPVMRSLRSLTFDRWRAESHEGIANPWCELLVTTERPLRELRYTGPYTQQVEDDEVRAAAELDALCECAALPQLGALTVAHEPAIVAARFAKAPVVRRLEHLGFVFNDRQAPGQFARFAGLLKAAPVASLRFELEQAAWGSDPAHMTTVALSRGAKGYDRAVMVVGPTVASTWSDSLVDGALAVLENLQPTLRELRITTRPLLEREQVARLRAAATRMKLDVCEVS
ncbi:MAG: TIGR02996 domain-containing protein [Deltaproteobacteria bacterium]|nr:TIGR02996 domain-containing protein [Deltaproteobacteria bacterium]MDQ3299463.1 TIGR02996 domain-containing protein [Myxococcota bacterium]